MDIVIKKEKDDDGSGSHGSWLDLAVDNRTCEWCSAPYDMRTQLPNYVEVPLDDWHKDLLLDLCYCFDCVQEYHRLQDELLDYDSRKILHSLDIQRLAKTITHALNNAGEGEVLQDIATHLQVPLLEILKFPYLLHHKELAGLFTRGLIALNVCGCPLKLEDLEEKLPGTYLLLVHHDPEVRGWAVRSVRGQGLINQDDYDVLKQVIGWMIEVVEFNLFEYSDIMTSGSELFEHTSLPAHIFIQLTIKEYWLGLFVLLRQMDVETMQSCFMSFTGHNEFLNIIVLPMANQEHMEDDGAFWPRLQCFIVLLERLGIKNIWQISVHKPDQLFTIITENYSFHNAVMHWQSNEDEEASSQEMFGDLCETRIVSGSSDSKHSSRFYKTALAWFQPFVQSVLDFDSHNDCVSHVIDYLHNLAGGCSHENIFKSDVLSVLLSIVHQLLAKRKFELLLPTVCIWAIDVVDVVIFELGDKKIVEGTRRLLQHLLKDMHRRGHWRALKHWQKFILPRPKQLSTEDRQEIVSLLVQSFEAQHNAPVVDSSCSKAPLVLPYGRSKAPASFSSPVRLSTKAPMAHSRHGTKAEWLTKSNDEMDSKTSCQFSLQMQQNLLVKEVKVENSPSVGNADCLVSENRCKVPHGKLQSYEEPGPSTHSTISEDEETRFWTYKKRDKNTDCLASENRGKAPHGKLRSYEEPGPSTFSSSSEDEETGFWTDKKRDKNTDCLASENRGKAPHGKLQSYEEPSLSTCSTSSEDKETGFWACEKRDKKPKRPSGKARISKSSQRLKGTPIYAKLQLEDYKTSVLKVKTETSIGERVYQGLEQPKKRHKARKSAGMIKKHRPIQQSSGATSDDPIVLSDDDEDAIELREQKEQTSTKDKGAGILDDHLYYNSNENHEVTLQQLRDGNDSPPRAVETSSTVQDTVASRSLDYFSGNSEPDSSDEDLLTSYMESKNKNVTSFEPSEHQVKTEKTDLNTAYSTSLNDVLHESGDLMDYDNESDDFAPLKARTVASRAKTEPVSGIQSETVSNSSGKADLSSDSDDELLSSVAPRRVSKSTHLQTSARDVVSKVKNEEILSESKILSSDEVINTPSQDASAHKTHFHRIETEDECSNSLFADANEITHEVDYFNNMNSNVENENHEMEVQTVKPEPAEEGEYRLSLCSISKQLENANFIDSSNDLWDDYGYSELVVNSQENALARVEEDLDDLYSTQVKNLEENDTIKSSPYTYDAAFPDEAPPKAKPRKRVTFADDTNSANTVVGPRPSVSQAANTKPTRALSEDELFREILNWKAERLCKLQSNNRPTQLPRDNFSVHHVPNFFDSMDNYYKIFKPLLLMEIWGKAICGWWDKHLNRKCVVMDVLDGSNANSFWLIPCRGVINENQHRNAFFPMESDLVVLTLASRNERGGSNEQSFSGQSAFGFVEKADARRVQSSRKVSVGSSGGDDEPKFHLTLNIKTACNFRPVRNCRIRVEFVTSLLPMLRQWCGLRHLCKSILASDILRPRKADYFCSVDYSQSSRVAKEYNESQEKVISTAANAVHKPFPIPRICLVQGPPGTGKSFTIVGLVKEILNRAQEMPPSSMSGPSNGSLANKVRILLCAPSNAAIDELIVRIRKAQIQLDKRHDNKENKRRNGQNAVKSAFSNNCGDLCLVRVGRKSLIHPSVMKFSLESMTKQIVENASTSTEDNLTSIKEKLQSIASDEKKLQHEIWMLQTSPQSNAFELKKLETEKAKLIKLKNTLEQQYRREKDKQANKRREESRIRKEILQCADVICTTLCGAGSSSLKQDLAGRRVCPFTCVIVDEACQCNELDLLIPLWFQASKLVLVGDPEQLPSTVMSVKAKEKLYGRSMFERLYKFFRHNKEGMGKPVLKLEEQYRMHPEIAAFPSSHVYNNWLKSHSSLEKRPFPLAKHYALFDVLRGGEISQDGGALSNPTEVDLIVELCRDLAKILHVDCVGIITPYRQQKGEIQKRLMAEGLSRGEATIEVNTVDGFQGREKDVIILSCVRAQNNAGSIGFLSDRQRMNVALTRARHALYVFGHMRTLKRGSPDWQALIDDADERHCLFPVESPRKVRSVLSIGLTNDIRSPAKDPRSKTNHISAQASDFHGNGSTINNYDVHQMDTSLAVSCSGSAVERSERHVTPVSTCGKELSVTAERRAHTTAAEMVSEPLPGNGQRDGHPAESRKMIVNSSHSTKQAQENHGAEGVRYRERHQKETMEAPRHRPRSDDHRCDPRRHGNRDSRERDSNHRNHHRQEHKNGAPVESKSDHTQKEHARYHSSHRNRDRNCDRDYDHRDRDNDRDRDCERIEGSAFQERQMKPGQNRMSLDTRFPSTISTFDEKEVCNEDERHCSSSLEIDTQDPHFISLLEYNGAYNTEYFVKLHQQERQSSKSVASPVENGWSPTEHEFTAAENESPPAETTEPPYKTTSNRIPYRKVQPRVETTVSEMSNVVASARFEKAVSQSPNPGVTDTLHPPPTRITQHSSSTYSSAAPLPSTSNATYPNALSGRTSAASSFSLSSGPDISQPSTSLGGNRSLNRRDSRSELSPDAQIASDKVRQRNPPAKGTQEIPISSVGMLFGHGGSRKRKAHADTRDVIPLRQRATSGDTAPSRRSAIGATRNTIEKHRKKYAETLRGRKNWK